jgi:hypothetical protein
VSSARNGERWSTANETSGPIRARFPIANSAGIECFKGWQPILTRMLERLEATVA